MNDILKQPVESASGVDMARRRFQNGSLFLRGKRIKKWVGRWLTDEILADGTVRRRHKSEVLGTLSDFPTKKLAMRALRDRMSSVNSPYYRPAHRVLFSELLDKWQCEVLPTFKPSSQSSFSAMLPRLKKDFGGKICAEFAVGDIQRWIAAQLGTLRPKTIRNYIGLVRLIWKYGRANTMVEVLDFDLLRLPERGLVSVASFMPEQARLIIQEAKEPWKTLFWILAETGMRGGEVVGLMAGDVDCDKQTIKISRSAWRGKLQTPKTKNAIREILISERLAEHLREFMKGKTGLLFPTRNGNPQDNYNLVSWQLHPILTKLGMATKDVGLHAFRHCNVSVLDSLGAPLSVRLSRVGHATAAQNLSYSHAQKGDQRDCADKLGAVFACSNLPQMLECS